ncbi:MAG: hypothetical protein MR350_02015 [Alphaproteobacteria bacterium]|nr:hypothetical protein [Alphaproteobacteria bacterium]
MGYNNMTSFFKTFCAVSVAGILSACSTMNNNEAAPERYSDLHFDNKKPIELTVKKIEVKSEFTPSFTRPNVEHLFPISIEKTAKTWADERLEAVDYSSDRVAEFIIKDASVTEKEEKAEQLLQKDRLKYHANLSVLLKVTDNKSSAQTSVEAYRELSMPIDTNIEDKERYWNEMVVKLFNAFDEHMEMNIHKYLNMYIKGNTSITEY